MRSPSIFAVCVIGVSAFAQMSPEAAQTAVKNAPAAMKTITAADLEKRLRLVASDEMQGRLTATPAQIKMAHDMAAHFRTLGLEPLGVKNSANQVSYLQGYPVITTEVDAESGLYDDQGKKLNTHGAWSLPRQPTSRGEPEETPTRPDGPMARPLMGPEGLPARQPIGEPTTLEWKAKAVFLGSVDRKTSLPEDLSLVIPVVSTTFDTSKDEGLDIMSATMRGMQTELGAIRQMASLLQGKGARCAVILVPKFNLPFLTAGNTMLAYPGKPSVRLDNGKRDAFGTMVLRTRIPILVLGGADAAAVAAALKTTVKDFAMSAKNVDLEAGPTLEFRMKVTEIGTEALNTVGLLRGKDPELSKQAVVYSAHMDHVGMAADGSVFNGADDDGSGTVTLMELAEAFAKLPPEERPARSVIFLSVSGEELGLWGSAHYADNPTWPADQLIANINIDMIGRSTAKVPKTAIAVTPTHKHRAYSSLGRDAAFLGQAFDLTMANGDRFYSRSDHYNFAKKGIPVVFFCDDEHPDYHLPSDDPEKIEYDKVERVARLAFLLGYRTATATGLPSVLGKSDDWFAGEPAPEKGEGK